MSKFTFAFYFLFIISLTIILNESSRTPSAITRRTDTANDGIFGIVERTTYCKGHSGMGYTTRNKQR